MTAPTAPLCAYEWSGYPHPGAAEFGEPDHYECDAPATWRVYFPPTGQYDPDGTVVDFCGEHYVGVTAEDPAAEAVLIAELPDVRCGGCGEVVWLAHPQGHTAPCDYCTINGLLTLPDVPERGIVRDGGDHPACSCPEAAAHEAAMSGTEPADA